SSAKSRSSLRAPVRAATGSSITSLSCPGESPGSLQASTGSPVGAQELEEILVDPVLVRGGQAVRRAGIVNVLHVRNQPGRLARRVVNRDDLVVLAVQQQGRHVDLPQVVGEIGLGEGLHAVVRVLEAGLHAPQPELVENALRNLRAGAVGAVKLDRELLV